MAAYQNPFSQSYGSAVPGDPNGSGIPAGNINTGLGALVANSINSMPGGNGTGGGSSAEKAAEFKVKTDAADSLGKVFQQILAAKGSPGVAAWHNPDDPEPGTVAIPAVPATSDAEAVQKAQRDNSGAMVSNIAKLDPNLNSLGKVFLTQMGLTPNNLGIDPLSSAMMGDKESAESTPFGMNAKKASKDPFGIEAASAPAPTPAKGSPVLTSGATVPTNITPFAATVMNAGTGAQPNSAQPGTPDMTAGVKDTGMPGATINGTQTVLPTSTGRNDDFLAKLPPATQTIVKRLADGDMQITPYMLRNPESPGWSLLHAVAQYDPTFNQGDYTSRSKVRNSFTSGPDAAQRLALDTVMAHIGTLKDSYDKLGNTDYPAVNTVNNFLGNQLGDKQTQENTAAVSTKATAVAHELAKVFRQSGMSEGEIKDWQSKIDVNAPPSSSNSVINSAMDLVDGRLGALGEKYNTGMGTAAQGIQLLSPASQATYNRVKTSTAPGMTPIPAAGGSTSAPAQPAASPASDPNAAKIAAAKAAGYSDQEIQQYLAGKNGAR